MNRRGFLKAILAAGVAPYVSTAAGVLMPIRQRTIWLWGDGIHDDTEALQTLFNGGYVKNAGMATAENFGGRIFVSNGRFLTSATLVLEGQATLQDSLFIGTMKDGPLIEVKEGAKNIQISGNVFEESEPC